FVSMLGNVKAVVTSVCLAIALMILFISANTMAMAARERVTEIAVLRTLGFRRRTILGMVLGEAVLLALVGGVLGVGLFVLLFPGLKEGLLDSPMAGFAAAIRVFPAVLLWAFAVTVLVGILSGIVPAVRAARRPITEGLRQAG
ncbi:ABC transporter permease, partial [Acidobacteria bacterium ACD]|nr:ABC transporter permease [Acidobacteria bacterium ACD]